MSWCQTILFVEVNIVFISPHMHMYHINFVVNQSFVYSTVKSFFDSLEGAYCQIYVY